MGKEQGPWLEGDTISSRNPKLRRGTEVKKFEAKILELQTLGDFSTGHSAAAVTQESSAHSLRTYLKVDQLAGEELRGVMF